jgi:hypothetical protein
MFIHTEKYFAVRCISNFILKILLHSNQSANLVLVLTILEHHVETCAPISYWQQYFQSSNKFSRAFFSLMVFNDHTLFLCLFCLYNGFNNRRGSISYMKSCEYCSRVLYWFRCYDHITNSNATSA